MHDTHTHALGPGALLLAEISSGSLGGHVAHVLGAIPPWLGGGMTAIVVGVTLRVLDPVLRDVGEHVRGVITRVFRRRPPPAP